MLEDWAASQAGGGGSRSGLQNTTFRSKVCVTRDGRTGRIRHDPGFASLFFCVSRIYAVLPGGNHTGVMIETAARRLLGWFED
jgi:hypothetical protein